MVDEVPAPMKGRQDGKYNEYYDQVWKQRRYENWMRFAFTNKKERDNARNAVKSYFASNKRPNIRVLSRNIDGIYSFYVKAL